MKISKYRVNMYVSDSYDTELLGFIYFDNLLDAKKFSESFTRVHSSLCLEVEEVENED